MFDLLKGFSVMGEPDMTAIELEPVDKLVAVLAFARSVRAEYESFAVEPPTWLLRLIHSLTAHCYSRFWPESAPLERSEP